MLTPIPPQECMEAREAASARLDGELSELEEARLDAHLAGCGECSAYEASIAALAAELRVAPLEELSLPLRPLARRRVPTLGIAAAACALVAAVSGTSSFALGRLLRSDAAPQASTAAVTLPTALRLREEATHEQRLAMLDQFVLSPPRSQTWMRAV